MNGITQADLLVINSRETLLGDVAIEQISDSIDLWIGEGHVGEGILGNGQDDLGLENPKRKREPFLNTDSLFYP